MEKELIFSYTSDYRSGTTIVLSREDEDSDYNTLFSVMVPIPQVNNNRLLLIGLDYKCECSVLYFKDFIEKDIKKYEDGGKYHYLKIKDPEIEKIQTKIFTMFLDSMPFVTTGFTCSYKEEGYYPEIEKEFVEMENIPEIEKIVEEDKCDVVFITIVNSEGEFSSPYKILPAF